MPSRFVSISEARRHLEEVYLRWNGEFHFKVGDIRKVDEETIVAEIVTADGSPVERLKIDCCSGAIECLQ